MEIGLSGLPTCPECKDGILLPFEDCWQSGSGYLKAWACSSCKYSIMLKNGEIVKGSKQKVIITEVPEDMQ